jgi:alpha-tubulin suppressor-like RCC1 family protein
MQILRARSAAPVAAVCALVLAACGGGGGGGSADSHLGAESYPTPVAVSPSLTFTTLESSEQHACGTTTDGALWCWGSNAHGELATAAPMERCSTGPCTGAAQASATALRFVALSAAAGNGSTCGLVASGDAYCWGGIAGAGGVVSAPTLVAGGLKFVRLRTAPDGSGACGLTGAGALFCWGSLGLVYGGGQKFETHQTPTAVQTTLAFVDFDLAQLHACGVGSDGQAYCWGDNWFGQLGQGSAGGNGGLAQATSPRLVAGLSGLVSIVTSSQASCALAADGSAECWGTGAATGFASNAVYGGTPAPVQGGLRFVSLAAGLQSVCGLTAGGAAYCWGSNLVGQLGNGTLADSALPVKVVAPVTLQQISHRGACAIGADGLAWCWGLNAYGGVGRPPYDAPAHP